jgi:hypothetical protein
MLQKLMHAAGTSYSAPSKPRLLSASSQSVADEGSIWVITSNMQSNMAVIIVPEVSLFYQQTW